MIRTQVYLTQQERELLRQLAYETNTSKSQIIREALDTFFNERETAKLLEKDNKKTKGKAGLF